MIVKKRDHLTGGIVLASIVAILSGVLIAAIAKAQPNFLFTKDHGAGGPRKSLYVASPLGFSELGRASYVNLLQLIRDAGYEVIDPWKLTDPGKIEAVATMVYGQEKREAWERLNREIGATNAAAIERSDGIVAVLDGPDVDSGTAAEVGYGSALKKPIIGYRGDFRLSADNEGSIVNLQVEFFVLKNGGALVRTIEELRSKLSSIFK